FFCRFQTMYGIIIVPVHIISFYLLLFHTKKWARAIRIGYLCNQLLMFSHDIWTCFLFRGYVLLPYPVAFCSGLFCSRLGSFTGMGIEMIFMIHFIFNPLFLLLMMQQQVMHANSGYRIPK
ncbi:hypothetical protein PFISCL1PPCAC_14282, partial [Pristionchus fissidentatus]